MRIRERGIGNMAFISVLVLFVVAAALAFVWRDEGETHKAAAATARADLNKANESSLKWEKLYRGVIEVIGMSDAALVGGSDNPPQVAAVQDTIRTALYESAQKNEVESRVVLDTKSYQFDESKGKIIAQEGDAITVQLYTNALSKETITLKAYLDYWPAPLQNAKAIAEANNKANAQTNTRLGERGTAFDTALQTASSGYSQDATTKQSVIDTQKGQLTGLQQTIEEQTAKLDAAATAVEQTKQAAEQQARRYDLTISALENRLRNEQVRKELALAEDPADGSVILVSNTYGTVWIDIGRRERVSRGTRFKVWQAAKGNQRRDIAVVEVFRVDDTKSECKVVRTLATGGITKGMSISNPFFDATRQLNAYIFGNLRTYPNEVARRRLAASDIAVARYLDDTVNIIILGEPPVSVSEVEDEEEAASIRRKQQLERSKRLEEILEKARSINALVVTEDTLATFIDF